MNTPTATRPSKRPNSAPTGLWKVLCVIAERLPPKDLFRFAVLVCFSGITLAAITCFGVSWIADKPAKALAGFIKQNTVEKPDNAP